MRRSRWGCWLVAGLIERQFLGGRELWWPACSSEKNFNLRKWRQTSVDATGDKPPELGGGITELDGGITELDGNFRPKAPKFHFEDTHNDRCHMRFSLGWN